MLTMAGAMTSCSNKKVKEETAQTSEGSIDDLGLDDSDFIVDEGSDAPLEESMGSEEEVVADNMGLDEMSPSTEEVVADNMAPEPAPAPAPMIDTAMSDEYVVQEGETLMWIAFKLYGDYRKWRELRDMNPVAFSSGLQAGTKIKYNPSQFRWNPQGLPHLIKSGETLGTISNDKYGTSSKWRKIYDNNRDMIRDPNLIFAGFTLYYIAEDRDIASE